jgi:hypothetical protein
MAIDLDAIRNKLDKLQNQTTKQNNLWKPEPGKQQIRIVPYQHNKENPFLEMHFHYDLAKRNYLSPMTYGRPDPVVEFSEKLKSSGNSDEWKLGKKMEPKMRTYVPVVVRGKESEGVKFWGFGKTVYTELLGFIADPDYGDITDPMNGRDIVVEFTPSDSPGTYPKTAIRVKPNTSALTEDRNIAELVASKQPNISDIFKEPSYEELEKALENWLNPEEGETAEEAATAPKVSEPAGAVSKVDNVSDAFDELFNN